MLPQINFQKYLKIHAIYSFIHIASCYFNIPLWKRRIESSYMNVSLSFNFLLLRTLSDALNILFPKHDQSVLFHINHQRTQDT